ncbi:MAG: GIY-YIG nuclease family protein [Planctomycetes bacterium]|nr:GIY-YIG nuclease family protein [Planctomycetota bacterium]
MAHAPGTSPCWSVYLVRRSDGALYAGIATDPERRLVAHRAGTGAKALRGRGPLTLVWSVGVGDRGLAQRVEAQLKRLPKDQKEQLVASARFARSFLGAATGPVQPR